MAAAGNKLVESTVDHASACWPEHDWPAARYRHGAFHDVLVLPEVVARITTDVARVEREHRTSELLRRVDFPFAVPKTLSGPRSHGGRTGVLVSRLDGELRPDIAWADAATELAAALSALSEADPPAGLPEPRTWCGGQRWPSIVMDDLVPRLPKDLRDTAAEVVAAVIVAEFRAPAGLVHGDFGPHNLLWRDGRISGVFDWDHLCVGDPAIDLAPLVGIYGAARVAEITDPATLDRAMTHRATLSLQVAAAGELSGNVALRDHALGNFVARARAETLRDPGTG
ncbi:aminoglycoside phosphotransferase family protein [Allokutzneria oryzae]|uniref:Aminoglycoside phosphotransferase family protein n=1 Tax=Allokutzneria oryzae TaxID=1378989 RepID=A0ABV5ZT19_9PSEU